MASANADEIATGSTTAVPLPFSFAGDPEAHVMAFAVHAGHDVRPAVAQLLALDDATRLREEDPFTDRLTGCADFRGVAARSRFEVDLNRPRTRSVYRTSEDAWGLDLWRSDPPRDVIEGSLAIYDQFYAEVAAHLDRLAANGPFVILDVHSYNHRRAGPGAEPAAPSGHPDVNVGTGSMPSRWRPVADAVIAALGRSEVRGELLDVRENVNFEGGHFARWVHQHYPSSGCVLALEFKKTFMDEWTGTPDLDHLDALGMALRDAVPPLTDALARVA